MSVTCVSVSADAANDDVAYNDITGSRHESSKVEEGGVPAGQGADVASDGAIGRMPFATLIIPDTPQDSAASGAPDETPTGAP